MATVLVTGAAGFVGGHLLELLELGDDWIIAWFRPGTDPSVLGKRVGWLAVEMHDPEEVRTALRDQDTRQMILKRMRQAEQGLAAAGAVPGRGPIGPGR